MADEGPAHFALAFAADGDTSKASNEPGTDIRRADDYARWAELGIYSSACKLFQLHGLWLYIPPLHVSEQAVNSPTARPLAASPNILVERREEREASHRKAASQTENLRQSKYITHINDSVSLKICGKPEFERK